MPLFLVDSLRCCHRVPWGSPGFQGTEFGNHWFECFSFKLLFMKREVKSHPKLHLPLPELSLVLESQLDLQAVAGGSSVSTRYPCLCLLPLFTLVDFLLE